MAGDDAAGAGDSAAATVVTSEAAAVTIDSEGHQLWAHIARRPSSSGRKCGLVLAHGLPTGQQWVESSGKTYPEFADRLANESDWVVLAFNFRGVGRSQGDFSLAGWLADLRAAVRRLEQEPDVGGVWLAGFRTGGALALCAAAEDPSIRGVATFGAPADFHEWAQNPRRLLAEAKALGVIRSADYPADIAEWSRQLREIRPVAKVAGIPPRPVLIVHGSIDDTVPISDARVLADAAEGPVDLRVITGAGHRLRHDPRAVAVLIGWLDRQTL